MGDEGIGVARATLKDMARVAEVSTKTVSNVVNRNDARVGPGARERVLPKDIAIVGIDDIEDGRYATPSLTTIAPDKEALAQRAVDLLLGRIEGAREAPPGVHIVPFALVVRESTIGRHPA